MIVRTYTNMWNEEKKLYAINDITLPTPIGFKQIGLFAVGAVVWMPLMYIFSVPITNSIGAMTWFSVPVLFAILGNRQFNGKTIIQYFSSWMVFLLEPKRVLDGQGISAKGENFPNESKQEHEPVQLQYTAWTRDPLERI